MIELLPDKVAVVTGGSSGIGRATALAIARAGARGIVLADVRDSPREGGESTVELIEKATASHAVFVKTDVTKQSDIEQAIETAERMGGVDILVNNAGVALFEEDFLKTPLPDYERLMDVNVKGIFLGTQAAARRMAQRRRGSIINISSIAGMMGTAHAVAYCASKGAVRLMSYAMADALGKYGIRVNVVHPGVTETTMTMSDTPTIDPEHRERAATLSPLNRIGQPADIAAAVVYLASDLAAFVNGTSLVVDGGALRLT